MLIACDWCTYLESKFNPMALAVSQTARTGGLNSLQYKIGLPMAKYALANRQSMFDTASADECEFICTKKVKHSAPIWRCEQFTIAEFYL